MQAIPRPTKASIEDILYPVNGYRGALERKGITPKDHKLDNAKKIKEKHDEFITKQKKAEESKKESILNNLSYKSKDNWKMAKFKNVESAVRKTLNGVPTEPKQDENVSDNKPLSNEKKTRPKPKITSDTKPAKKEEMPMKKEKKPAVPRAKEQLKLVFLCILPKLRLKDKQKTI